jgi:hypothetical protein
MKSATEQLLSQRFAILTGVPSVSSGHDEEFGQEYTCRGAPNQQYLFRQSQSSKSVWRGFNLQKCKTVVKRVAR